MQIFLKQKSKTENKMGDMEIARYIQMRDLSRRDIASGYCN